MKRKLWTILLSLIAALCLCFGLVACSDGIDGGDGKDGKDGLGIKSAEVDENGHLILTLDDGTVLDAGKVTPDEPSGDEGTEGLQYQKIKGENGEYTAAVVGLGTAWDTDIVIPDTYRGLKVTAIANNAFNAAMDARNANLTSVEIPDSVTAIENDAFGDCDSLKNVVVPDSVTTIGENAFYNCDALEKVTIGSNVNTIGSSAFSGCGELTDVVFGTNSKTASIGDSAFEGCSALTGIELPDSVTSIERGAFSGCSGLTSITIPDSVTSIGICAFYDCGALESVKFPDGLTSIGGRAFYDCGALTNISIPDSVTLIEYDAFYGCNSLTAVEIHDLAAWCKIRFERAFANPLYYAHHLYVEHGKQNDIIIPNGIAEVKEYAFCGCQAASITIPDGVTSIGEGAFQDCSSLKSIEIPDSVTSIGLCAFYGCSGLTSISIGSGVTSVSLEVFSFCDSLESIEVAKGNPVFHSDGNCLIETKSKTLIAGCKNSTIPSDGSVVAIKSYAFSKYSSLTSITIPVSVTSIEGDAFFVCINLINVYYGGSNIEWLENLGWWNAWFPPTAIIHCTDGDYDVQGNRIG